MAYIVGITGGIGSGKSAVSRGLREMGYYVYDTDSAARRLMETDEQLRADIVALLGDVYDDAGWLMRQRVAQRVFSDAALLEQLNSIVHPAVFRDLQRTADESSDEFIFAESAILFESKMDKQCRYVVTIAASEDIRIERAMRRDGASADAIRKRIQSQMTDEERARLSQFVVKNEKNTKISDICFAIINFLRNFGA